MADRSKIEWTSADDGTPGATWNAVRGCSRVSPGCGGPNHQGGCYAEKIAARFSGLGQPFEGYAIRTKHGGAWTGKVGAAPDDVLMQPLRWKRPRRIFVNSMSDLFHEDMPEEAIDRVFAVMALAPHHIFQVLTKRSSRMRDYCGGLGTAPGRVFFQAMQMTRGEPPMSSEVGRRIRAWPLKNVWLGVSVEDPNRAEERIPDLLETPAAVRFLSCEPLLGPVRLDGWLRNKPSRTLLDWIIAGGESGPRARPSHPDWFRALRDQCRNAGVPFFFKQWGNWIDHDQAGVDKLGSKDSPLHFWDDDRVSVNIGKSAAGATLDGVEHKEFP